LEEELNRFKMDRKTLLSSLVDAREDFFVFSFLVIPSLGTRITSLREGKEAIG
jgi:hypothetical protein